MVLKVEDASQALVAPGHSDIRRLSEVEQMDDVSIVSEEVYGDDDMWIRKEWAHSFPFKID